MKIRNDIKAARLMIFVEDFVSRPTAKVNT